MPELDWSSLLTVAGLFPYGRARHVIPSNDYRFSIFQNAIPLAC
jgi:hypothetical protein